MTAVCRRWPANDYAQSFSVTWALQGNNAVINDMELEDINLTVEIVPPCPCPFQQHKGQAEDTPREPNNCTTP